MRKKPANIGVVLLVGLPLAYLAFFYFMPLSRLAVLVFSKLKGHPVLPVNWRIITSAAGFTFFQAGLSTILTLVLGLPASYLIGRFIFRGKEVLRIASTLPFILPTVVVAAGFNALIGPSGWLNLALMKWGGLTSPPVNLQNSLVAILLAHVFYNTSIVIRLVGSALAQLDRKMEDAARTLGADNWQVLKKVTIPLLIPSIISATLLVFLFNFTSFGVILMLGGPQFSTLEVEIYIQTMQFLNLPLAGLLSLLQLAFTMVVSALLLKTSHHDFPVPLMPRLKNESIRVPVTIREKVFVVVMVFILFVLLVSPVLSLVFRSFAYVEPQPSASSHMGIHFSVSNYRLLFVNTRQSLFYVPPVAAIWNSVRFAVLSTLLALFFSSLIALGLKKIKKTYAINMIMLMPLGTSAVTLGLAFFISFSAQLANPILAQFFIPFAHALIALPFALRILQPTFSAIPPTLGMAAQTLGAKPVNVWRFVELPLVWRPLMTAAVYAFTISLGEFGATSFLSRPDLPTLPLAIFRYLGLPGNANYGQALAMAVIVLIICIASMIFLDHFQFALKKGG